MMKKNTVISLRLDDDEMDYLQTISKLLDVSPSKYIRMMIDASMVKYKVECEVNIDEYEKSDKHD